MAFDFSQPEVHPGSISCVQGDLRDVGVVIPTWNAERHWTALQNALQCQGIEPQQVLIIDSSSRDRTRELAQDSGYRVSRIEHSEFSHGKTRQLASCLMGDADVLIYLSQDAVPADRDSFRNLHRVFEDPKIGAAYGRQVPRPQANAIERHARLFNYPDVSAVRTYASRERLGIKAAFLSNSFAAYRRSALNEVGGFPEHVIMAEDSVVAAQLLIAGWKVGYVADSVVFHSHPLSLLQEFSRYFDTGVHHAREHWLLEHFGGASDEGKRFLYSEFRYLLSESSHLIPMAAVRTVSKWMAYQLGLHEKHLAPAVKARLSSQPQFWQNSEHHQ